MSKTRDKLPLKKKHYIYISEEEPFVSLFYSRRHDCTMINRKKKESSLTFQIFV